MMRTKKEKTRKTSWKTWKSERHQLELKGRRRQEGGEEKAIKEAFMDRLKGKGLKQENEGARL
jgi:hypothetical protein